MKLEYLTYSAAAALAVGFSSSAMAADQTPDTPAAATAHNPAPSLSEELVYLRDRMAVQALRLDEAEQMLQRQQKLMDLQNQKIAALEKSLGETARLAAALQQGRTYVASAGGDYSVRRGDTLARIARSNNTTVAALARANNLRTPYRLDVGQQLTIPGAPAQAAAAPQPQKTAKAAGQKVEQKRGQRQPAPQPQRVAQNQQDKPQRKDGTPTEVGVRPEDEGRTPEIEIFSDIGGILTPKGTLYAEPAIDVTASTDNRFSFQGVEIVEAVLIGLIEATDRDRKAALGRLGFRYGVTDRLEIAARASYVYRNDLLVGFALDDVNDNSVRDLEGKGLGDIDFSAHYQLNNGRKWPFVIANLRANAPTGRGPFDIARNPSTGTELELATGSGYWSVEPSLTFILPSDPAVIFANIGYQHNIGVQPDASVGPATIREFNPGDAIKVSLGVGLSLNERLALNFGYEQNYFLETTTLIEQFDPNIMEIVTQFDEQPAAIVGSFLFGGSYKVNSRLSLNLNSAFGATDQAPDMRISLKARVKLFD